MAKVYGGLDSLPEGSYKEFYTEKIGRQKLDHYYRCNVDGCNHKFSRSTALIVHVRKHFNMRPYECHICKKSYTQSGTLKRHIETIHADCDHE